MFVREILFEILIMLGKTNKIFDEVIWIIYHMIYDMIHTIWTAGVCMLWQHFLTMKNK